MQTISEYKRNVTGTSILTLLLVILTTFSSCTSRKAVQAHFDMPVTKTLNPIKSAINDYGHCITIHDFSATAEANKTFSHSGVSLFKTPRTSIEKTSETQSLFPISVQKLFPDDTPLYILFRQIKAFI